MEVAYLFTVYAFIGWIVATAGVLALWAFTFWAIKELGANLLKIYRIETVRYWMGRLQKEGTHCFRETESNDDT